MLREIKEAIVPVLYVPNQRQPGLSLAVIAPIAEQGLGLDSVLFSIVVSCTVIVYW